MKRLHHHRATSCHMFHSFPDWTQATSSIHGRHKQQQQRVRCRLDHRHRGGQRACWAHAHLPDPCHQPHELQQRGCQQRGPRHGCKQRQLRAARQHIRGWPWAPATRHGFCGRGAGTATATPGAPPLCAGTAARIQGRCDGACSHCLTHPPLSQLFNSYPVPDLSCASVVVPAVRLPHPPGSLHAAEPQHE